ncbi:MAG: LysR family transcriptional regulator [Rhodospirillales bacterium]
MAIIPPRPKFPPLNALRAFEAAARLSGIAPAAEELCVTPAAVSQHIKTLEAWAGTSLFERRSQGVRLTAAGEALAPHFERAFDQLGLAVAKLRSHAPHPTFNIAALPGVAQLWLPDRLPVLRPALSPARLSVFAVETPPNLRRDIFDLSLFIRELPDDASHDDTVIVLEEDLIFPVCTPALAANLRTADDLSGHTLLHDSIWSDDWACWAEQTGTLISDTADGLHYSLYSIAIEEAKSGAGILMAHQCLVGRELRSGSLVRPLPGIARTGKALVMELRPDSKAVARAADILQSATGTSTRNG